MSSSDVNTTATTETIFDDPAAYLAALGIEAELVVDTTMPVAA